MAFNNWDSDWLHRIAGGYDSKPPAVTQADLQKALREKPVEPPPVLTGKALYELFFQAFFSEELTLSWEELHLDSRTGYDQVAQVIGERYIAPAVGVTPAVGMAWADILHALRKLVKEWYHYSFDPGQGWKPVWELRKKAEELLGKDFLLK